MQQLVQRFRLDAGDGDLLVDQPLAHHVHRRLQRGFRRALAGAGLQHEELAFLHGEFHVLHVAVMLFQPLADGLQFGIGLGHGFFHATAAWPPWRSRTTLEIGCGVRMPATTSSPWALIRNSP